MTTYTIEVDSAPAFQDALKAILVQRAGLQGLSVCVGPPSPGISQEKNWLAFLDVKGTEDWATLGRLQREENYTQEMYISVLTRDGEGDSTRGRDAAYAIRAEVANALISDPTVSGTVWQASMGSKKEFFPRLGIQVKDANGMNTVDLSWREAALYFDILVKNRLHRIP